MLNGNERRPFYRILFPGKDKESGLTARVPDVNETRLNGNFKIVSDEFRRIWDFIKNGFTTKTATVEGDASVGGDLDVSGDASVGGSISVTGNAAVTGDVTADDVTVNGVLDVTKRRCDASLSSVGWYRVFSFNIGANNTVRFSNSALIDINILSTYNGTNNMAHRITLMGLYTKPQFVNEISGSNTATPIIDKIRYTYGSDYKGHVDVHYSVSSANNVDVRFDENTRYTMPPYYVAESLQAVDDAPSGETVMAEYTFLANTDYGPTTFTPTSGTSYANYGGCYYEKRNGIMHVHVGVSGLTANTTTTVYTLPSDVRPVSSVTSYGVGGSFSLGVLGRANAGGAIEIRSEGTYAQIDFWYMQ